MEVGEGNMTALYPNQCYKGTALYVPKCTGLLVCVVHE